MTESGEMTTFGAYQPLDKSEYLPDIKWNPCELDPESDVEPIPCVLGACYAASKRYWNYFRGLEGLIHYGSEEAYISYKVWLEGGRCLLLKRHAIGHIYRNRAPYVMVHDKIVYNYLFISEMVFPRQLRNWSHAIAHTRNAATYRGAITILENKARHINGLREYYNGIFTRSFSEVQQMHRRCMMPAVEARLQTFDSLTRSVMEWHVRHLPTHCGVADGAGARIVWLFNLARVFGQAPAQDVFVLLDGIRKDVEAERVPWNFANGLCGLGWLHLYLYSHGFTRSVPSALLHRMDSALTLLRLDRLEFGADDFLTGPGGLLCYSAVRLAQLRRSDHTSPLSSPEMLSALRQLALRANADTANLYTRFNALQLLDLLDGNYDLTAVPSIQDWTSLPDDLASNPRFWNGSLSTGCIGHSLLLISMKSSLLTYKNHNEEIKYLQHPA